ncbi:MAG: HAD family hydrolase [Thiomargarita sp.]|nr:HAD family hydrolase [Thiomargarita sp.]
MIIFFDIGGTIASNKISPVHFLLKELGLQQSCKDSLKKLLFTQHIDSPYTLNELLAEHFHTGDTLSICKQLWHQQIHESYYINGALTAINCMKSRGYQVASITNIWEPFLIGLHDIPKPVFRSDIIGIMKPDVLLYTHILKVLNIAPSQAIMVGDDIENDIIPANSLGMKTILVGDPDVTIPHNTIVIRDISSLPKIF